MFVEIAWHTDSNILLGNGQKLKKVKFMFINTVTHNLGSGEKERKMAGNSGCTSGTRNCGHGAEWIHHDEWTCHDPKFNCCNLCWPGSYVPSSNAVGSGDSIIAEAFIHKADPQEFSEIKPDASKET